MGRPLRVLVVEDSTDDTELMLLALRQAGLDPAWVRVETAPALRAALAGGGWDAVLSDYTLPELGAYDALGIVRAADPDLPFIVVSGTVGEDVAAAMMRAGANDYVIKYNLDRLAPALERELREADNSRARARADGAVRGSEERYRRLFEAAQDGILIVDEVTRKVFDANPFLADLLGYTRGELVGKELWEIGLFQDIEANKAGFRTLQKTGYVRYDDLPLRTRDGRHIAVEFVSNVYDVGGTRVVQCNIRDITAKKRAEAAERAGEERLRSFVENVSAPVAMLDRDMRYLHVSRRWLTDYRLGDRDVIGLSHYEVFPDLPQGWKDIHQRCLAGVIDRCEEARMESADGTVQWIRWEIRPWTLAGGEIGGIIMYTEDITARKRVEDVIRASEERVRLLLDSAVEAIYGIDTDGRCTFCNAAGVRILGYPDPSRLVGRHMHDLIHHTRTDGTPYPADDCRIYLAIRRGEGTHVDDEVLWRADGTSFPAEYWSNPIRCEGRIEGAVVTFLDITERKKSGAAIRASEERYRTLVAATAEIVWDSPPSGAFDADQPAWTAFTGQTLEQHMGWGWLDAVHPDDREEIARAWAAATKDRTEYQVEHRLRRADGEYRQMTARAVPILDPGGAVREWVGVHTDITDRKRAEVSLSESQKRLALATESAGIGIWEWDVAANAVVWDARMLALYGVRGQKLTVEYATWRDGLHPDDRDRAEAELAAALAGVEDFHTEFRVVRADGEVRHVEAHALVQRTGGSATRMTGVNWDITDRKRAEDDLRLRDRAIRAATQGLVITDPGRPDNPLVYVSPGYERMTGYGAEEVLGRNCRLLQGGDTDPAAVARLRAATRAGDPCTVELLNYRKDGTPFWNELSISPVRDAAGRLTHFVGVLADVTARRSLEEQFRQAQKMEAVGRLAGGVAHDFNNLLTIINGYSDLLLQTLPPGDPSRDMAAEIHEAGERSAGLTRQLLAFSRQQMLAPRVLDLNGVAADADRMLRRLIGEDVRLATTLAPGLWPVRADPGQVEQVLMNLAVNARDAMPTGGRLTIETRNVDLDEGYARTHPDARPGPHVLLAVSDTGGGMPPDVAARVFEPFFTTKGVGKGTGLGLATVYGIVRQSGGHVAVYSEVGAGTSFKVYLPRVERGDGVAGDGPAPRPLARGTETVLVVEDEAGVRTLARRVLAGCGYEVLEAADGAEAARAVAGHAGPIHLLVTDVVMPGVGGRVVAERVAATHPGVRVLFVSGYTDDAVIRHGVLGDGVNFLQKPFSPAALAAKVRDVLDAPAEPGRR